MRVLMLGYSSIVQRRVLPALASLGCTAVDIASRTRGAAVQWPTGISGRLFTSYAQALHETEADLAYVSTTPATHAPLAVRALEEGLHVVVDKPAVTHLDDARRLVELAARQDKLLAEATVYAYHPQFRAAMEAFREAGSRPTRIAAVFSIPPLPADNFRYRREDGGGALLDMGPYALTPGRLFFGETPRVIACHRLEWRGEVETAFAVLAVYGDGRSLVGQFGFTTGYANRLDILGPDTSVTIARYTSLPADVPAEVQVTTPHDTRTLAIGRHDAFGLFLNDVRRAIEQRRFADFARTFFEDATAMARLRNAASATT